MKLNKNKKEYLICRMDKDGVEGLAYMDPYSGNLSFYSTIDTASRIGSIEEAREIVKAQETLSKMINRDDKFKILEIETTIKEIEG